MRKKVVAAVAVSASLLVGGAVGAVVFVPGAATAASSVSSAVAPKWVTDALDKLVSDGTIDQGQADAVGQALEAAKPARGPDDGPHHGGRGPGLDAVTATLGMTAEELHTALESGQTIAEVAAAKGVDVQVVIDAMVSAANTHIDSEVGGGHLTQAQADQMKADLTTRITDMVNNGRPDGPDGRGPAGPETEHRGPGQPGTTDTTS